MANRRAVAIAVSQPVVDNVVQPFLVVAACDDGTIWAYNEQRHAWGQLPDLPPPEPKRAQFG
jgi:hypothetical protein